MQTVPGTQGQGGRGWVQGCLLHLLQSWVQVCLKALSGFTGHAQKDSVLQFPAEITIQAGENTALHCNFSTSYTNPSIYWYQQRQSQSPQMLLQVNKWKSRVDSGRFSSTLTVETSQVLLNVRDAELQDSAAYFCALSTHCSELSLPSRSTRGLW
uniref:Ig-like domain-containing protein n=1 Tax=Buteo japonicus TaxID=224669 RepID=A0A8C0AQW6_9AVES